MRGYRRRDGFLSVQIFISRNFCGIFQDNNSSHRRSLPVLSVYNGTRDIPGEKVLKLSDGYIVKTKDPMLELKVRMININLPAGHRLLRECVPLYEYSWFIERVRAYIKEGQDRDSAVPLR